MLLDDFTYRDAVLGPITAAKGFETNYASLEELRNPLLSPYMHYWSDTGIRRQPYMTGCTQDSQSHWQMVRPKYYHVRMLTMYFIVPYELKESLAGALELSTSGFGLGVNHPSCQSPELSYEDRALHF